MLCSLALLALFASVQGRAVNISNTWVLPEEGFPVFYRYFRDRISWYEADAVCQFHHANLVTVDTTAQYDAVRAYLKELDISSAVWVGLIRSNPDGDFTWTDYRGLSGDGYWSSAPDARAAPLCAAADPAADYRWEARACGGPTVASFICELPVPQWALGAEGCMIRALPALTVLYLPESAAVQLTADCGLAGVKRVQCTGNVKREDLLKDLSCAEDEELSSTISVISTDTIFTDSDTTNEPTTEETTTTEHEDDINQPSLFRTTMNVVHNFTSVEQENLNKDPKSNIKFNNIILNKNINLDVMQNNNLQSNDISKVIDDEKLSTREHHFEKLEDEKLIQHKLLHDEIARRGNFETIFTQPTDHFVPPLVMAKAKISDDMTVISLEQKHAQQLAEQRFVKHNIFIEKDNSQDNQSNHLSSENPSKMEITDIPFVMTTSTNRENEKKEKGKSVPPKKYNEKYDDPKNKISKILVDSKPTKPDTTTEQYSTPSSTRIIETQTTTVKESYDNSKLEDDPSIDLTVIIKEPDVENGEKIFYSNYSGDVPKIATIRNESLINVPQIGITENILTTTSKYETPTENQTDSVPKVTLNHEIIKITIVDSTSTSGEPETVFEITTRTPIFKDTTFKHLSTASTSTQQPIDEDAYGNVTKKSMANTTLFNEATVSQSGIITTSRIDFTAVSVTPKLNIENITNENSTTSHERLTTTAIPLTTATILHNNVTDTSETNTIEVKMITTSAPYNNTFSEKIDVFNNTDFHNEDHIRNATESEDNIDDFQSPLLSAANEPLHRPNRSRRPQTPPSRLNKFNPFRILG